MNIIFILYCISAFTRSLYVQIKHGRLNKRSRASQRELYLIRRPHYWLVCFSMISCFFFLTGGGGVGIYTTLPPLDKSLVLPLVFLLMLLLFQNEFREYPALLRHAVSLGRRIQDPLTEFAALCVEEDELLCLRLHPYQVKLSFCNHSIII